jgi:hypothetical protein
LHWTTEQILKLAPDASSAQTAQGLLNVKKWVALGATDRSVWGLCQGSGSKPYQAQIDLSEPAFKCSCPSRKFPCKHGLALFLLYAEQANAFGKSDPPEWVTKWIESRSERAAKKEARAAETEKRAKDPEVAANTAAKRQKRVEDGIAELRLWLEDLIRMGLAAAASKESSHWDGMAARLVDAQAPGLARMVRELRLVRTSGAGWQDRMLERASRIFLLIEGYERLESLPPDLQLDLKSLVGWTQEQEEIRSQAGVTDEWCILGQRTELDDRLQVQRAWLQGTKSKRRALILTFSYGNQAPFSGLVPGTCFDGELVFFPGRLGLRALVKARRDETRPAQTIRGANIASEICMWSTTFAQHPWLPQYPVALTAVVPVLTTSDWKLIDQAGDDVPLHPRFAEPWAIASLSGGYPVDVAGEWDGDYLMPMSILADRRFIEL